MLFTLPDGQAAAAKPLGFPSSSLPRAGLPQRPLAIRALGEAALFQRLQRKGYGSIADVSACRPDMLGDLGGRKGALLAENVSDRRAYGLARLRLVACLGLAFWVPCELCWNLMTHFEVPSI